MTGKSTRKIATGNIFSVGWICKWCHIIGRSNRRRNIYR